MTLLAFLGSVLNISIEKKSFHEPFLFYDVISKMAAIKWGSNFTFFTFNPIYDLEKGKNVHFLWHIWIPLKILFQFDVSLDQIGQPFLEVDLDPCWPWSQKRSFFKVIQFNRSISHIEGLSKAHQTVKLIYEILTFFKVKFWGQGHKLGKKSWFWHFLTSYLTLRK